MTISKIHHYANLALGCLEEGGYEARIAGGAVRDIVMGIVPKDFDIATTATPEQVIDVFRPLGFKVIETGIKHGTVTVVFEVLDVAEPMNFEVTTLRIDKKTDGRHAEVEFVTDWKADAARRDFTMNAMYMNKEGDIFDYFDGHADIFAKRVRFVGNAEDRIKEDYLRIMRYYRFLLKFPGQVDHVETTDLEVIEKNWKGLEQVSGERIWSEMKQILKDDRYYGVMASFLYRTGNKLFGPAGVEHTKPGTHYMIRFMKMFSTPAAALKVLIDKFKCSTEETFYIFTFNKLNIAFDNYSMMKEYLAFPEIVKAVLPSIRQERAQRFAGWLEKNPNWQFPCKGSDLLAEGFTTGPALGAELEKRNRTWAEKQF